MPRSRNPENYPTSFKAALERATSAEAGLRIEFNNPAEMMRTRASMYAYINALDAQENEQNIDYGFRLAPLFRQIMLKPEGRVLILMNKLYTNEVQAIERALGVATPPSNGGSITGESGSLPMDADALAEAERLIAEAEASEAEATPADAGHEPIDQIDLISRMFPKSTKTQG